MVTVGGPITDDEDRQQRVPLATIECVGWLYTV